MKFEENDHPGEEWLHSISQEKIDRDIKFVSLLGKADTKDSRVNKVLDRMRCFVWELYRTKYYTEELFRDFIDKYIEERKGTQNLDYPMSISSWPSSAYLEMPVSERIFWKMEIKYWGMFEYPMMPFDHLFPDDPNISEDEKFTENLKKPAEILENSTIEIEDIIHYFSFQNEPVEEVRSGGEFYLKRPITFYLEPNISKVALKSGIEKYWGKIESELKDSPPKKEGAYLSIRRTQIHKVIDTALKQLGLYRLLICCGKDLEWHEIMHIYGQDIGEDRYGSDDLFRKQALEKFPNFFPLLKDFRNFPLKKT